MRFRNGIGYKIYFTVIIFMVSINISFSQWIYQSTPNDIGLILTIDFSDSQNGFGGGYIYQSNFNFYGRALYTTNAGLNWILAQVPDSARALVSMQFLNSSTGYCAGACNTFFGDKNKLQKFEINNFDKSTGQLKSDLSKNEDFEQVEYYKGLFYKTTDGGQIWNTFGQLPSDVYYLTGLSFLNSNTGYVTASYNVSGGVNDGILKTTNGGISWNKLPLPDTVNSLRNIFFTNSSTGFAVGYNRYTDTSDIAVIIKTTNAGASWQLQTLPGANSFIDIYFSNSNTGFAAGGKGSVFSPPMAVVFKTTNAGTNWQPSSPQFQNVILQGVRFVQGTATGLIYGNNFSTSNIFTSKTTNYGQSWVNVNISDPHNIITGCDLLDQTNWYIAGGDVSTNAVILHSTHGGVGIEHISSDVPDGFNLNQNYPNPFNPKTVIRYSLMENRFTTLQIFDILGNEVATLVNEKQNTGTYEYNFDGANIPSGIYFYKITAGEFSEIKKMLLIK